MHAAAVLPRRTARVVQRDASRCLMYGVALLVLLALALALFVRGFRRKSWLTLGIGLFVATTTLLVFGLFSFWGEMLWFEEVGFLERFWTVIGGTLAVATGAAFLSTALVALITLPARHTAQRPRRIGAAVAGVAGAAWGTTSWSLVFRWVLGPNTGEREPILGHDTGFYLFTLPFIDALFSLLLLVTLISALVAVWSTRGTRPAAVDLRLLKPGERILPRPRRFGARPLHVTAGAVALLLAGWFTIVAPAHLLYSSVGTVHGPGWTDVNVRLPAYYALAVLLAVTGIVLLVPRTTRALERTIRRFVPRSFRLYRSPLLVIAIPAALLFTVAIVGLGILPGVSQWLKVGPNELALERPYIANSIAFTRKGFGLDRVEEAELNLDPAGLTPEVIATKDQLLSEVRLWDPRALHQVLQQFQSIRLYYELTTVDIDRYTVDDRYRQMMVAPREMKTANLPESSQTFVNRHFQYTHGYGLTMTPVSDFTKDGLPDLVVRDLPPVSDYPSVEVRRPEIYYGELTNDFVVVNTRALEFDYPSGAANVYTHYQGRGGVELRGLFRRLAFGWKVGGTGLLFSEYPTDESRIMFNRNVRERVAKIAPFLVLDHDPYLVLVDGRLKWIIDAYTTSTYYPYSETLAEATAGRDVAEPERWVGEERSSPLEGVNYVRNSVKAVVDAYDGSVSLYVFESNDPLIRVWQRIFPRLFRPASEMPPGLRAHVRYPEELLNAQGLVYAKFHMTAPDVFYNQEDLWVRAREQRRGVIDPYYAMWQAPGSDRAELILMQPFTPRNRQVLIGWIAGMCDGDNYGRLLAYRFSKDRWILGPQQVDTKIDQSPDLSAQLTLWDQHGKRVIRGNILAIPIGQTLLYVEPIYLQAEAAAYPELRIVVTMHGDAMSYAPTFKEALTRLVTPSEGGAPASIPAATSAALDRAQQAFDEYTKLMSEGRFEEAGARLRALRDALASGRRDTALPMR